MNDNEQQIMLMRLICLSAQGGTPFLPNTRYLLSLCPNLLKLTTAHSKHPMDMLLDCLTHESVQLPRLQAAHLGAVQLEVGMYELDKLWSQFLDKFKHVKSWVIKVLHLEMEDCEEGDMSALFRGWEGTAFADGVKSIQIDVEHDLVTDEEVATIERVFPSAAQSISYCESEDDESGTEESMGSDEDPYYDGSDDEFSSYGESESESRSDVWDADGSGTDEGSDDNNSI